VGLAAAPARADRQAVVALGITGDARATGASSSEAGHADVTLLGAAG